MRTLSQARSGSIVARRGAAQVSHELVTQGVASFVTFVGMTNRARFAIAVSAAALSVGVGTAQTVDLPTSKQLLGEIPGHPQKMNSLPSTMVVSPDHRYVVTVNDGYGTFESNYDQSIAVYDTQSGTLADFPDERTSPRSAKQ